MNVILRPRMLHLTNGDAAVAAVRRMAGGGDVLPWRDALHEGDPAAPPAERARLLAGGGAQGEAEIRAALEARDARLRAAVESGEPIFLWFEADLYDVLQVLQILDRVERASLVMAGEDAWRSIQDEWRGREVAQELAPEQIALARAAWAAIASRDPREVERIWRAAAAPQAPGLPGLVPALERWLEQLPWTVDALTRSERALLTAIAEGAATRAEAFVAAQRHEQRPFLGDSIAFGYLDRLGGGDMPLLEGLALTDAGRAVLAGRERWRRPEPAAWEWDPAARRVVAAPLTG